MFHLDYDGFRFYTNIYILKSFGYNTVMYIYTKLNKCIQITIMTTTFIRYLINYLNNLLINVEKVIEKICKIYLKLIIIY